MKLDSLLLENYMGWAKIEVDLSKYSGITAILGSIEADMAHSNGTGKSSLIAAINYALYGTTPKHCPNLDGMIRQGFESVGYKVVLRFSEADVKYEITRKKKAGSVQRTTFKDITNNKAMAVTPEEFLHMPEVVWQNTVFSAQRNLAAFVDELPSARKDILTEIFGMNNYLALEDKARQLATKTELGMARVSENVIRLAKELESYTGDESMLQDIDVAIAAESTDLSVASNEMAGVEAQLAEIKVKADQITAIHDEIARLERTLQQMKDNKTRVEHQWMGSIGTAACELEMCETANATPPDPNLPAEIQAKITEAESARAMLQDLNKKLLDLTRQQTEELSGSRHQHGTATQIQRRLDSLPVGKCPTCGTDMTEEHLNKHKAELQAEISTALSAANAHEENLKQLSINLQFIREDIAKRDAVAAGIQPLTRKLMDAQKAQSDYQARAEKIKSLNEAMTRDSAEMDKVIKQLDSEIAAFEADLIQKKQNVPTTTFSAEQQQLQARRSVIADKVKTHQSAIDALRDRRTRTQFNIEQRARISDELTKFVKENQQLKLEHDTHLELVRAFGPSGIPTLILENCLSELQQYLDYYMDLLSDGKIHITFQTVKTNATTAKKSETLTILVSDISGERDIALYSGGETVRIYLAIRLALAKLLYLKSGQKLGLLIIDEIADLDDAGLKAFVELLKRIEPEFEQILLVSHIPELKGAFDNALVLSRDVEGNYIPVS